MRTHKTAFVPYGMKDKFVFADKLNQFIITAQAEGWEYSRLIVGDRESLVIFSKPSEKDDRLVPKAQSVQDSVGLNPSEKGKGKPVSVARSITPDFEPQRESETEEKSGNGSSNLPRATKSEKESVKE